MSVSGSDSSHGIEIGIRSVGWGMQTFGIKAGVKENNSILFCITVILLSNRFLASKSSLLFIFNSPVNWKDPGLPGIKFNHESILAAFMDKFNPPPTG